MGTTRGAGGAAGAGAGISFQGVPAGGSFARFLGAGVFSAGVGCPLIRVAVPTDTIVSFLSGLRLLLLISVLILHLLGPTFALLVLQGVPPVWGCLFLLWLLRDEG